MANFDSKSELLRKADILGKSEISPEQYERMRKMAKVTHDPNSANYPAKYRGLLGKPQGSITDYARIVRNRNSAAQTDDPGEGASGIQPLEPVATFLDGSGRKVKLFYPPSGSISIQFFLVKEDNVGKFFDAICRVMQTAGIVPQGVNYEVNILSELNSVNVYFPAQQFPIGFKTYLQGEVKKMFG